MAKINNTTLTPGTLPSDYQEALSWNVTEKPSRAITLNIFGLFFFVIFGIVFFQHSDQFGKVAIEKSIQSRFTRNKFGSYWVSAYIDGT